MRNFLTRIVCSAAVFGICSAGPAVAQRARIAGLERNGAYMELLGEQERLKACEDSTAGVLSGCRNRFETAEEETEREELGREIVRLEGELFEVRNRMGRITAQVAAIEQDYVVNHLEGELEENGMTTDGGATEGEKGNGAGERTLFANAFFGENLSAADVALFTLTPRVEPEVRKIDRKIGGLYEQLKTVKRQHEAATDQEVIDSLAVRAGELKEQIEQVDALMERLWLKIYLRKLDCYLVLLDRIGSVDRLQLERLDQESRQVRRTEGLAGEQLAPLVATYPLQKLLALDYELVMARELGLQAAEDSLAQEFERMKKGAPLTATYPDVPFETRSVIVYSPITKTGAGQAADRNYTTVEDVPRLQVPKAGLYYTVQIALYTTRPKGVEAFKGMTPVMSQRLGNGQTRYVAGGFRSYAEAQAAATQMIRAGLRASVVAFADGKQVTAAQAKALEAKNAPAVSDERAAAGTHPTHSGGSGRAGGYQVEIVPAELRLPVAAREVIAAQAPGKTIVRSSSGNEVVYLVGSFATQAEAEKLAGALRNQPNVKIKVVAL